MDKQIRAEKQPGRARIGPLRTQWVGIVSLVVSVLTFSLGAWNSWIAPFEPVGTAGPVMWQAKNGKLRGMVALPIRMFNRGAHDGIIDDVELRLDYHADTGQRSTRCLYMPVGLLASDYVSKLTAGARDIELYKEVFPTPILLPAHQHFSEQVEFTLDQPPEHPNCDVPFLPCRYHAEVLWLEKRGSWKTLDTFDGRLDESKVANYSKAAFTVETDSLEERRKELRGK